MTRRAVVLAIALATAHCVPVADRARDPQDAVRLSADRSGGKVLLTLENDSRYTVGYNLCASTLERRDAASWKPVDAGDVCTRELHLLKQGDRATFTKTLPPDLSRAEYRYVTAVEMPAGAARVTVSSAPFEWGQS